jgi:hypothetical protein
MRYHFTLKNKTYQPFINKDIIFVNTEIEIYDKIYYRKKHEELKQKYESQRLELIEFKTQAHYWKKQFEQYSRVRSNIKKTRAAIIWKKN